MFLLKKKEPKEEKKKGGNQVNLVLFWMKILGLYPALRREEGEIR